MSFKLLACIGIALSSSITPMASESSNYIQGVIYVSEVNQPIIIHISNIHSTSLSRTFVSTIYENGEIQMTTSKVINILNNKFSVAYSHFEKSSDKRQIVVEVKNGNTRWTSPTLDIYSCEQSGYSNSSETTLNYSISIPVATHFTLNTNSQSAVVSYDYERVTTTSIKPVVNDYNRYVTFPKLSLFLETIAEFQSEEIATATLRLYNVDFPNTDLFHPYYDVIDIEFPVRNSGKWYYIENEYRFYQDKYNGSIYENYNDRCSDVLHPFFIPLNSTSTTLNYAFIFKNVGMHKNTFYIRGKLDIERAMIQEVLSKFYYEKMDTPLLDVSYEQ